MDKKLVDVVSKYASTPEGAYFIIDAINEYQSNLKKDDTSNTAKDLATDITGFVFYGTNEEGVDISIYIPISDLYNATTQLCKKYPQYNFHSHCFCKTF